VSKNPRLISLFVVSFSRYALIPKRMPPESDEHTSSISPVDLDSSHDSTVVPMPLPYAAPVRSYFLSTIESAIKQRLDDEDEPIPFIDENLSIAASRKSSACWSDRTSLSSRFGLSKKWNLIRASPSYPYEDRKRKRLVPRQHRTMQFSVHSGGHQQISEQL
jgi:hypothetical protein